MIFTVEAQELGYDGFDDIDGLREMLPFHIEASSLESAKELAEKEASRISTELRKKQRNFNHFETRVIAIVDRGGVRHQIRRRWSFDGWQIRES